MKDIRIMIIYQPVAKKKGEPVEIYWGDFGIAGRGAAAGGERETFAGGDGDLHFLASRYPSSWCLANKMPS